MKTSAMEYQQMLEAAGQTSFGPSGSHVTETCQMMGSESVINDQNFEMAQSEPQQGLEVAPTTGFDLS